MASNNGVFISAGVYQSESDLSFTNQTVSFSQTSLGMITPTLKGQAFVPTKVENYVQYIECFGNCSPCFIKGTKQMLTEGSVIAREFLSESNSLYVTRVLGLSGTNMGTGFGIVTGGAIDVSTSTMTGSTQFQMIKTYNDGQCVSVIFDDEVLQNLYDCGEFTCDELGTSSSVTGDTINTSIRYYGNCKEFTGADIVGELVSSEETILCITGTTTTGATTTVVTTAMTGTTVFSAGTVTYNSTLTFDLTNGSCTVSLINTDTSSIKIIDSGIIQFVGGTITHNLDGTISIEDGTVILPNEVLQGGTYKLCDYSCATVSYVDCPESGLNYQCITGETSGTTVEYITGVTTFSTKTPSGIVTQVWSGVTNQFNAQPLAEYDNKLVALLRSKAYYDSDQILNFYVPSGNVGIQPVDKYIAPYGDFTLAGVTNLGETFEYNVSLNRRNRNYIKRVFGDNLEGICCTNDSELYVEEFYENMLEDYVENGYIHCLKPQLVCCGNIWDYQQEYTNAVTPYLVSELQGNSVRRLFRFHTVGDGNAANSDIKVSITNINPDNATFDVQVRRYGDSDSRPVIIKQYARLNLDSTSTNYIARRIGDVDNCFEGDGCYLRVEMASDCMVDSFPSGFEGYPVRDYCNVSSPELMYKKCYDDFEKKRKVYLGVPEQADTDFFNYKGIMLDGNEWTGTTKGYHLDMNAPTNYFEVGCAAFQNNADLAGTDYSNINSRKFTVNFYGGWDGWDIHSEGFSNKDSFILKGSDGSKGLLSGRFDTYINYNNDTVINSDYYAWEKAIYTLQNAQDTDINLIVTPTLNNIDNYLLVEETIEMIEEDRCDSLYIFTTLDTESDYETPLSAESIVDSIDGLFDSSYAATYAGWIKKSCNDSVTGNFNIWLPPTADVVRSMAFTDKRANSWFAAAGVNRGLVNSNVVRVNWTQDDRDTLYTGRVNPLAKFNNVAGGSVMIWGNKTVQIDESSLDRINVRRLMLRTKKLVEAAVTDLVFEQNNPQLRTEIENRINPILEQIRVQQGLNDFRLAFDNSDSALDEDGICVQIFIQPTRAAEYICVNYSLTNTGNFNEL